MRTLLALETTGALCSVAIHEAGVWFEDTQNVARLHNQVLLAQIQALVSRAGLTARAFDVIAFGAGPGSFTGVRIAAAAAQGIALAAAAVIVPVASSRALAETARLRADTTGLGSMPRRAPGVVTVTRSRRDAYYLGSYAFEGDACRQVMPDALHQGDGAPDLRVFAGWVGVGDLPPWWPQVTGLAGFVEGLAVTAPVVGRLALADCAAGRSVVPEAGLPIYVPGDSPWQPSGAPLAGPERGPTDA